jgi:hypothetical protein
MRVAAALGAFFDSEKLVFEDGFGIIQQASDERAFAIIDGAGGRETEETGFGGIDENVHGLKVSEKSYER